MPKRKLAIQTTFSPSGPIKKKTKSQIKQNLSKILLEDISHFIWNISIGLNERCSYTMDSHLKPSEYKVSREL